jgi:hypothetical protein
VESDDLNFRPSRTADPENGRITCGHSFLPGPFFFAWNDSNKVDPMRASAVA